MFRLAPKRFLLPALLLLAALLRVLHVVDMRRSPLFEHPVMDPAYHDQWARSITEGRPITEGQPYFRAPLYPFFLAGLYRLGGGDPMHPRVVQAGLGVLSLFLMYQVAITVFPPGVGLMALFLGTLYPLFPYFEGELLITSLAVFLDLLLLLVLLQAGARRKPWLWLASGLLLGLSAVARPNILLFSPVIPLWLLFDRETSLRRRVVIPTLLVAVGTLLLFGPVTLRNVREGGERVWIAWQGGLNFYLGNHPGADGWSATAPGIRKDWWGGYEDALRIPQMEKGREMTYSEISSYWYDRGWRFIRENRREAAVLFAKKAYLLLHAAELSNNQIIPFAARYSRTFRFLPVGFGLLVPLALLGICLCGLGKGRTLLLLFLVSYSASILLFFVCSRYRMPLVPVVLLFAATGLLHLGRLLRARDGRGGIALGAVLLLLFALNHDFGVVGPVNLAWGYEGEGLSLLGQGRPAEAAERFREAIRLDPSSRNAHHDLGVSLRELGKLEEALRPFRASLAIDPQNPEAYNNLGLTLAGLDRMEEALQAYRRGIAVDARHPGLHVNLAFLLQNLGRYEEAIAQYRAFLRSGIADGRVHTNLGVCLIETGATEEGERELRLGVELAPTAPDPALILAGHLESTGMVEEAAQVLRRALEKAPGDDDLEQALRILEGDEDL